MSQGIPGVFEELHLRQIHTERVCRGGNCCDRRVTSLFGCLARLLGGMPNRFAFLPDRLQLLAILLPERTGLFSQDTELFRFLPGGFRQHAVSFGSVTLLIGLLPNLFSVFPPLLGIRTVRLGSRLFLWHIASLYSSGPMESPIESRLKSQSHGPSSIRAAMEYASLRRPLARRVSHIHCSSSSGSIDRIGCLVLHEFIALNRDEIIRRCRAKVATRSIPSPTEAEIDHGVPVFLDQLQDALHLGELTSPEIGRSAIKHGHDLLRLGFTVSQVVHDYGDVCQAITELAVELNAPVSTGDFRTLNRCLDDAIAGAVTEYGRERNQSGIDAESARGTERLGFLRP
jgi:hypothetical protein